MSWWVYLSQSGVVVDVDPHHEGGEYNLSDTNKAELNITFNYNSILYGHFHEEGILFLHGKVAKDVVEELDDAVGVLGNTKDPDYWKATMGNAGHALKILSKWAKQHPDAIFEVY